MDTILIAYPSLLRPIIKTVISCDNFGVTKSSIKVGAFDRTNLLLHIPYASRMLSWEVNFLEDNLAFAPDFNFGDDFLEDPDEDVLDQSVPALSSWNIEETDALLNVIKQLLALYMDQQLRILMDDPRLAKVAIDYNELLNSGNDVKSHKVEIGIFRGVAHFLIVLNVDFSALPVYSFPLVFRDIMDPGENIAYLHIIIDANANSRRCQSNLRLSPQVEMALGGSSTMNIPPFILDTTMCQYVTQVRKALKEKVSRVVDHYQKKMDFIQKVLSLHTMTILEYDAIKYEQISLLISEGDNIAEVIISIDSAFPQERPNVKLISIYQEETGKPKTINVHSYNYAPKMSAETMIINIFTKLQDTMKTFK